MAFLIPQRQNQAEILWLAASGVRSSTLSKNDLLVNPIDYSRKLVIGLTFVARRAGIAQASSPQNRLTLVVSDCKSGAYLLGGGLEPPRLAAYAPQTYVSAISPPEQSEATPASATGGGDASGKALLAWNVWFSRVPEGRERSARRR